MFDSDDGNDRNSSLYIGAVKSNIGHLEGGAGIAGVIKAVFCLNKRVFFCRVSPVCLWQVHIVWYLSNRSMIS